MIKIYTAVGCTNCLLVKEYLYSMKIKFKESHDIEKAMNKYPDIMTLPIIEKDNKLVFWGHFNEESLERIVW